MVNYQYSEDINGTMQKDKSYAAKEEATMMVGKIAVLLAVLVLFVTCDYAAADCKAGDRYEDNRNGAVTDCRTGLVWLKNANCAAPSTPLNGVTNSGTGLNWKDAMKWVAGLYGDGSGPSVCTLSDGSSAGDWRLPTKTEWMAMVEYARYTHSPAFTDPALTTDAGTAKWSSGAGSSFTNVLSAGYWSSTTVASDNGSAWYVVMTDGSIATFYKTSHPYVWPVRGGQAESFGSLRLE